MELAVYGKGGIGKSTVSANLSAALALGGRHVLQIGCDPKHDSTRLLMHGRNIPTVLDYLKQTTREEETTETVLYIGAYGVGCMEAGGPRPGVGCAGRGIISAFEFLDRHQVKGHYDTVVYDVLGDVVCGGFAVPVRREYADAVFLVTSGEYMALYAANNILRGIQNFDGEAHCRIAGIIYNERRLPGEDGRVSRFARAVGLPVCAKVPRSSIFAHAEEANRTVMELEGCGGEQEVFWALARQVSEKMRLYPARPLTDEMLETVVLGGGRQGEYTGAEEYTGTEMYASAGMSPGEKMYARAEMPPGARMYTKVDIEAGVQASQGTEFQEWTDPEAGRVSQDTVQETGRTPQDTVQKAGRTPQGTASETGRTPQDTVQKAGRIPQGTASETGRTPQNLETAKPPARMPLYGCAFNGAATAAIHLTDALVIAHSPRACAFYTWQNINSPGRKNLFNRGILMPSAISPNFECTDMGQNEVVYGGLDRLRACVKAALERKPGAVVVISSCTSGIIGDDIRQLEEWSTPDIPVIAICADGDIAGDYMEGILMCMYTLAERLIDPGVKPHGRSVNLIYETGVSNNHTLNEGIIRSLLSRMDIGINCRFLGDATCGQVKQLLAAPYNILVDDGEDGRKLRQWMEERYGCVFLDTGFPVGFQASKEFVELIGQRFGCMEAAHGIIRNEEAVYRGRIAALKPALAGKRVLMTTINAGMDWFLEAADAIGMEFVWIGVLNYLHRELHVTEHPAFQAVTEEIADLGRIHEMIARYQPDIVLSNYTSAVKEGAYVRDSMPMTPVAGFHSALHIFARWEGLLKVHGEGAWKQDEALFKKYFA